MKRQLTLLIIAVILFSSCYSTKIEIDKTPGYDCGNGITTEIKNKVIYTNTSSSKYLEVTIKKVFPSGNEDTEFIKLKPGEITWRCSSAISFSVVGEREITENE
jgi:hypothetical protein